MKYIVVTGYDKNSGLCRTVLYDTAQGGVVAKWGFVDEASVVRLVQNGGPDTAPLNFSIGPTGRIVQDCGDFSRFSKLGSAVVLAEVHDRHGKTTGYLLLSCANNVCMTMSVAEIVQREAAMPDKEHFLQNGVVRSRTVSCYPRKRFPVLQVERAVTRSGLR